MNLSEKTLQHKLPSRCDYAYHEEYQIFTVSTVMRTWHYSYHSRMRYIYRNSGIVQTNMYTLSDISESIKILFYLKGRLWGVFSAVVYLDTHIGTQKGRIDFNLTD